MASPKETGERVNSTNHEYSNSSTGIGCAIIASGIPVYFILVSEYPLKKPVSLRQFLGQNLHSGKKPSVFPPANTTIGLQKLFVVVTPVKKLDWSSTNIAQLGPGAQGGKSSLLSCPVLESTSQFQARIQFLRRGMKIFPAFKVAFQQTLHQNRLISN